MMLFIFTFSEWLWKINQWDDVDLQANDIYYQEERDMDILDVIFVVNSKHLDDMTFEMIEQHLKSIQQTSY